MGTVLIVDETRMVPGKLTEIGIENVNGLKEIVQWQRLTYNFGFHVNEFPVDSPVIALSCRGWSILGKGLFGVTLRLPDAQGAVPAPQVPSPLVPERFYEAARAYFSVMRELDHAVGPGLRTLIQEHFVAARKVPQSSVTQETLHLWMTLARLVALSYGEEELSEESWRHVLELEDARARATATAVQK